MGSLKKKMLSTEKSTEISENSNDTISHSMQSLADETTTQPSLLSVPLELEMEGCTLEENLSDVKYELDVENIDIVDENDVESTVEVNLFELSDLQDFIDISHERLMFITSKSHDGIFVSKYMYIV